jgi:hypothetical protein
MPVLGLCQSMIAQEGRCLPMLSDGPEIELIVTYDHKIYIL